MGKGQLQFKGDKPKKKKKKSKHCKTEGEPSMSAHEESSSTIPSPPTAVEATSRHAKVSASPEAPTIRKGTGQITTSGTVVTGYDTRFEKELAAGDALMCVVNGQEELRVITMRLSNQSLNLSSAFSDSIKTPTKFQYIRKPRDLAKERREAQQLQNRTAREQKQHAFDLYSSTEKLIYREKTETGSYRIKQQQVQGGTSRGDLLEMRAKKSSDKYC